MKIEPEFNLSDRRDCVSKHGSVGIPLLTTLSLSWGHQSTALLWMLIREEIERPANFAAISADPGMENSETYTYRNWMIPKAEKAGIKIVLADGPNLYEDLLSLPKTKPSRIDNPSYFTKPEQEGGTEGKLRQKCTKHYKVDPIRRAIRKLLPRKVRRGMCESWIGFAFDEEARIKTPDVLWQYSRFPLHEMGLSKEDIATYYQERGIPEPPRSVCNGCYANGTDYFKDMYENRPCDWAQAVAVDEAIRDMSSCGVNSDVYVHRSCIPLKQLPACGFNVGKTEAERERFACTSGYCFL